MSGSTPTRADIPLPGGEAVYNASGLAYYRHAGPLGSAVLTSTPSRTLASSTEYTPYGWDDTGSGAGYRSFTGMKEDIDYGHNGGQYDFLLREYSAEQGRWWTPDPAGLAAVNPNDPQSWNRYAYVDNMPLEATDPLGLRPCLPSDTVCVFACPVGSVEVAPGICEPNIGGGSGGGQGGPCTDFVGGAGISYSSPAFGGCGSGQTTGGGARPAPPSPAPNNAPQPKPQQPQHFWQKPGCGSALGELGVGLAGSALTTGAVVAAFVVGPEELVGFEGVMTVIHIAPVGVPGFALTVGGAYQTYHNCIKQ